MTKSTEATSNHNELQNMSVAELLTNINQEDETVPKAIKKALPQLEALVNQIVPKMENGGRMFYIGAGTSGRLGVVDASEIPPTFGLAHGRVVGLIAGGDGAIRKAVEHAEDDANQAWKDLSEYQITAQDVLIGIAASGSTPYVIGGLKKANEQGIITGCITCNTGSLLAETAQFPIEVVVGPEFVTGSTRMKAGTAQKLVLNMISTAVMVQLGHVRGNKMVDMMLSNDKLKDRAVKMVMSETGLDRAMAETLIKQYGNVRAAITHYEASNA
jgi:N-acetylmuramic acid 6-phosphate etherase